MLPFLLHHKTCFLFSILAYFVTTQLNYLQYAFNHIIKKIPISQHLHLLKIANLILLSELFFQNLLSQCGDTEKNPDPKFLSPSFCYQNLHELTAHDCIKITVIQAYVTNQNFHIICLSETFLYFSIQNDDHKVKIDGYNLIRSDHPSDSKKSRVCISYKEHIPVIRLDDLCTLDNCLVTEIRSQSKKCFLTCGLPLTLSKSRRIQNLLHKF